MIFNVNTETLSDLENAFVASLEDLLVEKSIDPKHLRIDRMGDGTLNFRLTGCQIGRIKLQGYIFKMQVLTETSVRWYQDESYDKCLARLPRWVAYATKSGIYDPKREVAR